MSDLLGLDNDVVSGLQRHLSSRSGGVTPSHPAILTDRGLAAALETLATRLPLPVVLDVTDVRLPEPIEASAGFFCSEALTKVVKHARATHARA